MLAVTVSLLVEAGLAVAVWRMGVVSLLPEAMLCHVLACLLFSRGALNHLGEMIAIRPYRDFWLFFSLPMFVPLVGVFGMSWAVFVLHRWATADRSVQLNLMRADRMASLSAHARSGAGPPSVNPGMLISVLQRSPKASQRVDAILATLHLPDSDAINILRVALRDGEDDIRLLAYALLAQLDKQYSNRIQDSLAKLEQTGESQKSAACKRVAQEYWELAWTGLAQGETAKPILDKALHYARLSLDGCSEDAGLQFLLGKILLRLKRYEEAMQALNQAELYGMASARIAPYLREIRLSQLVTPGGRLLRSISRQAVVEPRFAAGGMPCADPFPSGSGG